MLRAMLAGLLLLAASAVQARPLVVWNATASTPVGLWRVLSGATRKHLRVGDCVLFWPDRRNAQLFARRGNLPHSVPLLKRVAAIAGQTICERDRMAGSSLTPCRWTDSDTDWPQGVAATGPERRDFRADPERADRARRAVSRAEADPHRHRPRHAALASRRRTR
jgi:hypothetical protein